MNKRTQPSHTGSTFTVLLLCASLGLNALLAARLFHRQPSLPAQTTPTIVAPGMDTPLAARPAVSEAVTSAPATNAPRSFLWIQVESADYRQYIANLRPVGCPEPVIRDIIMADLNQAFLPRFAAIWKPEVREYWRKSNRAQPSPEQEKQLLALSKDKTAILEELLGGRFDEQQMINTIHLQLHGNEQNLLFLPDDQRAAALQALADVHFEMRSQEVHSREGYSNAVDQKLFNEALQALAKVLTPAELAEFRMRGSPVANSLRNELQYFNSTPEEFQQLLDSREHAANKSLGDLLNRTAATEEVRKLLGDERAKEFEKTTDLFYINARRATEERSMPLELADQAWQVTRDTRAAANRVARSTDLSDAERAAQLQSLQKQAEVRLNELLGPKAALGVIRDLRVVVNAKPAP